VARERILRTQRSFVTTWLACDVEDLFAVHSDAETMRFVRQGRPETRAETAALVDQYIAEHAATGFAKWRLADHDDHLVGRAGFGPQLDGRELGYTIRRDHWGQGWASEVGSALVTWHLANAAAIPLYAYVAVDNPASRRVLDKIGFESVGRENHCGLPCELFTYALTPVGNERPVTRSIPLRRDLLMDVLGRGDGAGADPGRRLRGDRP